MWTQRSPGPPPPPSQRETPRAPWTSAPGGGERQELALPGVFGGKANALTPPSPHPK